MGQVLASLRARAGDSRWRTVGREEIACDGAGREERVVTETHEACDSALASVKYAWRRVVMHHDLSGSSAFIITGHYWAAETSTRFELPPPAKRVSAIRPIVLTELCQGACCFF